MNSNRTLDFFARVGAVLMGIFFLLQLSTVFYDLESTKFAASAVYTAIFFGPVLVGGVLAAVLPYLLLAALGVSFFGGTDLKAKARRRLESSGVTLVSMAIYGFGGMFLLYLHFA